MKSWHRFILGFCPNFRFLLTGIKFSALNTERLHYGWGKDFRKIKENIFETSQRMHFDNNHKPYK
jgi:hypothetical protein